LGVSSELFKSGKPLLKARDIAAYYELHIEQGPVMVNDGIPVAVVTAIRGDFRRPTMICRGEFGHSGAVPRELRRDAVAAVVALLHRMEEHWDRLLAQGHDLVMTTGVLFTDPHTQAASRIEGEVTFSFDARSQNENTLHLVEELLQKECAEIAALRRVEFIPGPVSHVAPAAMDPGLRKHLVTTACKLGLNVPELPSGSGHDAVVFARHGVPAAMIFIRNQNGSHNPYEAMAIDDFLLGTNLLFHALAAHA
jgi:N-carbamoyl-L-amino-acid hydrolase